MNLQRNDGRDRNSNRDSVQTFTIKTVKMEVNIRKKRYEKGETEPTVHNERIEGEHPQHDEGGTLTCEVWDYFRAPDKVWTYSYRWERSWSAFQKGIPSRQSRKTYCTTEWSQQICTREKKSIITCNSLRQTSNRLPGSINARYCCCET